MSASTRHSAARAVHAPTSLAPRELLASRAALASSALQERQRRVEQLFRQHVGAPFYAREGVFLYHGDCKDLLAAMIRGGIRVDLTVTSPPYNIGKAYERTLEVDTYVRWCAEWMGLIHEATGETGTFWLNLGYFPVPGKGKAVPIPYLLWDKSPFFLMQEVVWNYGAGVAAKRSFSPRNEKWLFYVRDENRYTFNLDSVRDPDVKYPNQKKNGKLRCNPLGKNPSDVWAFPKVTSGTNRSSRERTAHPAQFPLAVVDRIVKASSNPLDLVLDPFCGSGSAAIAAHGNGRLFAGFEIRHDYCELAAERLERYFDERDRQRVLEIA